MRKEKLITAQLFRQKQLYFCTMLPPKKHMKSLSRFLASLKKEVTIENKVKKELEASGRFTEKVVAVLSSVDIDAFYAITESEFSHTLQNMNPDKH